MSKQLIRNLPGNELSLVTDKIQNKGSLPTGYLRGFFGVSMRVLAVRFCIVIGSIMLVSALHYSTTTQQVQYHDIFRRLYYLPIILGGIWFRTRGGLLTSICVSIMYIPHVVLQWGNHTEHLDQYLEIFLYNVVGFLSGFLTEKEWHQKRQLTKTAHDLEHSYSHLKEQAEVILDFEEQLIKSSRLSALGELSASLAHEIRNPLGSIRGAAEILSNTDQDEIKRAEFSRILIKETRRLNEVLENYLQFATTASNEQNRFSLHETLEELLVLTRPECERLRLKVSLEQNQLPAIPGNKSQIEQVFLNLILNAAQAMNSGGSLKIKTHCRGKMVLIQFKDDGPGISDENISKIFTPFFTTKSDGVGLGLAITNKIVTAHGGRIDIESVEHEGSTFNVTLPVHGT